MYCLKYTPDTEICIRVQNMHYEALQKQRRRWLNRKRGKKLHFLTGTENSVSIPTDSRKLPAKEITGAQNCNFAPKFLRNMGFSAPNRLQLYTTRKTFSHSEKFSAGGTITPFSPLSTLLIKYDINTFVTLSR